MGVGCRVTGTAFDNDWFALPEAEATALDPRQRVTLELAVEALDDSGLGYLCPGSRAAVVLGTATIFGPGGTVNIAHQLSRTLDLHGPSLLVASDRGAPLVAVDTAVRLLADESVPFVIAGGADLTLLPDNALPQDISGISIPGTGHATVLILQRTRDAHRAGSRRYADFTAAGLGYPHSGDPHARIVLQSPGEGAKTTAVQQHPGLRDAEPPLLIPLSARDLDALHALSRQYAAAVGSYPTLRDFAAATARLLPDRTRAAILAVDTATAATQFRALAEHLTAMAGVSPARTSAERRRDARAEAANGTAVDGNSCGARWRFVGSASSASARTPEIGETIGVSEPVDRGGVLFLFSGGGGHPRMGRALAARYPVFAAAVAEAADAVVEAGGPRVWTPRNGFAAGAAGAEFAQPALFAFQLGLAELLAWWGVRANAVAGHGVGEIAAAVTGGAITLAEGARIVVARGRLLAKPGDDGAAAVLEATPAEVRRLIEPMRASVGVAAIDGPNSITVSGDARYIDALVRRAHRRAIFAQRITPDAAAAGMIAVPHAPRAQAIAPQLVTELGEVRTLRAELPIFSTTRAGLVIGALPVDLPTAGTRLGAGKPTTEDVAAQADSTAPARTPGRHGNGSGSRATPPSMDAEYWGANAAGPVELGAALEHAAAAGISTVVEVGPHGVLTPVVRERVAFRESAYAAGSRVDEAAGLLRALGRLYLEGRQVDWAALGASTLAPPERRWARRVSVRGVGVAMPEVRIRVEGTYVVAGGLGDSGALVVRWLLDSGARDVVVLTRVPRALPEPLAGMEEWIVVVRCDASDRSDLAAALQDIRECGAAIRGVVHAGRELDRTVAAHLVELTAADPTDFTIGFSGVGWQPLSRVSGGCAPVTRE
ncbi:acyltransferase domain-containing protein [Nocardia sp. NBC_01503]|uniref:acyltransferase domain-containing protein n=1 Tax=Nocardia sp. NBC_01503 TaxID=2975997 RepID=UPI002E7BAD66|nr:acyltransferase domain-containing protein [Nocardia sp. NBC_01503]